MFEKTGAEKYQRSVGDFGLRANHLFSFSFGLIFIIAWGVGGWASLLRVCGLISTPSSTYSILNYRPLHLKSHAFVFVFVKKQYWGGSAGRQWDRPWRCSPCLEKKKNASRQRCSTSNVRLCLCPIRDTGSPSFTHTSVPAQCQNVYLRFPA